MNYFHDKNQFIDFCKKNHVVLYPQPNKSEVDNEICHEFSQDNSVSNNNENYCALLNSKDNPNLPDPNFPLVYWIEPDKPTLLVTYELLDEINRDLRDDESEIRKLSSWVIERTFVYVDISDFSKFKQWQQHFVILKLISLAEENSKPGELLEYQIKSFESQLCIGDGYIYVFHDALKAVMFACNLACRIELSNTMNQNNVEIHFRIGIHTGQVNCFWDPGRNDWNYIGDGINGGQRVTGVIGKDLDDVVFISDSVRNKIMVEKDIDHNNYIVSPQISSISDILTKFDNKGRRKDKHDVYRRVYQVNHTSLRTFSNYDPIKELGIVSK